MRKHSGESVRAAAVRRSSEVAALRQARLALHEADVREAVRVYFDHSGRAIKARQEAHERAERIIADAEAAAVALDRESDAAVERLKRLGEPVVEIASMTGLPVSGVRAALSRAGATGDT